MGPGAGRTKGSTLLSVTGTRTAKAPLLCSPPSCWAQQLRAPALCSCPTRSLRRSKLNLLTQVTTEAEISPTRLLLAEPVWKPPAMLCVSPLHWVHTVRPLHQLTVAVLWAHSNSALAVPARSCYCGTTDGGNGICKELPNFCDSVEHHQLPMWTAKTMYRVKTFITNSEEATSHYFRIFVIRY